MTEKYFTGYLLGFLTLAEIWIICEENSLSALEVIKPVLLVERLRFILQISVSNTSNSE